MPLFDQDKRTYDNNARREERESVREIGPPPKPKKPKRRDSCRHDLHKYLTTYHESAFPLAFSPDHIKLVKEIERVVLDGGSVVVAMPRGSGKTTICQRAELWAGLYGHRKYPMMIASDDSKFRRLLKGLKVILENNELLLEDFPEVVYPIRKLERIANRANFQMCRGEPTYMGWGIEQIVFPTIEESLKAGNAGVVVGGGGLTGAGVRGGVTTTPAGQQVRPDCVLVDDPQTRKSAKSMSQCQEREDIISGDILGMAGPGKRMAAIVACTVIYRDDLAARLLDQERSPDWTAIKVSTIKSWPRWMPIWEKYDEIRRQELLGELDKGSANQFYLERKEELEEGAEVYWDERVDPGRVTALQSAMDEYFRDRRAFMAERQNMPEEDLGGDLQQLSSVAIVKRVNGYKRGVVPADATTITAHIDVQERLLYWTVCAWSQGFRGYVIDYGTYPQQARRHFVAGDVRKTLLSVFSGNDLAGALRSGLREVMGKLSQSRWIRVDGAEVRLDRGLVDARWNTDNVEAAIVQDGGSLWMPSYGVGIRAKDAPIGLWIKKRGVIRGHYWAVQKPDRRLLRSVFVDVNYWKSQCNEALTVPPDHSQGLTLYSESPSHHQLFADHMAAERATRVEARGRIVDEWELPSNKPDNHFWDNLVHCMAAASVCGIRRTETHEQVSRKPLPPAKRVKQLRI